MKATKPNTELHAATAAVAAASDEGKEYIIPATLPPSPKPCLKVYPITQESPGQTHFQTIVVRNASELRVSQACERPSHSSSFICSVSMQLRAWGWCEMHLLVLHFFHPVRKVSDL
jgi:hypothetical protein